MTKKVFFKIPNKKKIFQRSEGKLASYRPLILITSDAFSKEKYLRTTCLFQKAHSVINIHESPGWK